MSKGRKRKPTKIKELQGTLRANRVVDNEMSVSLVAKIPSAPDWLSDIGKEEWRKVCLELYNKQMLHQIDLRLLEAYCNAISLHIECEMYLRENGRILEYKNDDGSLRHSQSKAQQKIANDALDRALKIATQFGFTPSARSSISQPTLIQNNTEYNFFE
tara:strand:- start:8 stop:484 length:477 start_codon:yes stop_codon:yes gene_type:complete